MPPENRVFISYSRKDKEFVLRLNQSLINLGIDVWLDLDDIRPGSEWSDAIQEGLDSSAVMMLIISPDSMASKNVGDEWKYFLDQSKPLIPLLLRPAKVHFQISRVQYIDFLEQPYDKALTQLQAELRFKQGLDIPAQVTEIAPKTQRPLQIEDSDDHQEELTSSHPSSRTFQPPSSPTQTASTASSPNLWLIILATILGTVLIMVSGQSVVEAASPSSDRFNPVIAIIVTLFTLFVMLSILASQILSYIQTAFNMRPRQLVSTISGMIPDPVICARLLTHPLLQLLDSPIAMSQYQHLSPAEAEKITSLRAGKTAYIPADKFVTALFDVLSLTVNQDLYAPLYAIAQEMAENAERTQVQTTLRSLQGSLISFDETRERFQRLTDPAMRARLLTQIDTVKAGYAAGEIGMLLNSIDQIQNPTLKNTLNALLFGVRSLEDARARLEKWFSDMMDRSSYIFKQKLMRISLAIGIILALLLNMDVLHIINTIPQSAVIRGAVRQALSLWETELKTTVSRRAAEQNVDTLTVDNAPDAPLLEQLTSPLNLLGWEYVSDGFAFQQQIGLDPYHNSRNLWNYFPDHNPDWLSLLLWKLVGLIIAAIAIAQGGPFLYSIMKRLRRRTPA